LHGSSGAADTDRAQRPRRAARPLRFWRVRRLWKTRPRRVTPVAVGCARPAATGAPRLPTRARPPPAPRSCFRVPSRIFSRDSPCVPSQRSVIAV